jgi:hypothetical protein
MRRLIVCMAVSLFLAGSVTPALQSDLFCTLTGKKIPTCCCQLKDGKLYCPLAKKTIETCCCKLNGQ